MKALVLALSFAAMFGLAACHSAITPGTFPGQCPTCGG